MTKNLAITKILNNLALLNFMIHGRGAQTIIPNSFERFSYSPVWEDFEETENQETSRNPLGKTTFQEVFPQTILNKVESPDVPFSWSLNPYQGCEHGCVYCYARNSHEFWGLGAGLEFESRILVKKNAPELLRYALEKRSWTPHTIHLAGNTDVYQPAERQFKITRKLLEIFLEYKNPVSIITKNSLIERDLDILKELAKHKLVQVNLSLTTLDESLKRVLEPRTSSGTNLLRTLRRLSNSNIPVNVMIAPVIPGLNDFEVPDIIREAALHGAWGVSQSVIRLNGHTGTLFSDWLEVHFPERKEKVLSRIKQIHGGTLNDSRFGVRMKGEGKWAEMIAMQFRLAKRKYFPREKMPSLDTSSFRRKPAGQLVLF